MSTTTAPVAAEPHAPFQPGRIARAIAAFSGLPGYVIKLVLLALTNGLAVWAAYVLADRHHWVALPILVVATAAINYTIEVAFSNYSTGHVSSKGEAISAIEVNSLQPPENGRQFEMAPARDSSGNLVLILHDDASGKVYVGTTKGLTPLAKSDVTVADTGQPTAAKGYTLVKGAELFSMDAQLKALIVPTTGDAAIQAQGVSQAVELEPTLRYDKAKDEFVRIKDGAVFKDNGKGSFVSALNAKEELEPGWKTYTGLHNFGKLVNDPLYRTPFLKVFVWTFAYATLTVFFSFAVGLFLAIALDKKGLRGQRLYRSVMVIPYAIPGFLSLLIWAGLLNDSFGVVNGLLSHLGFTVPWLFDANWAKVSVVLVSVWLTTPYFFLVSLGALQSIPAELTEAAKVDGGGAWAVFRRVTLPLLLVAVAPLMIASFAFNFNNFGNIYLLTAGGPASSD